jgi:hypothetical protein
MPWEKAMLIPWFGALCVECERRGFRRAAKR